MQIVVFNVNNLTDARYFSAMLADYLHIPLHNNDLSLDNFREIYNWVEGPQFICSFDPGITLDKKIEIEELPNYFGEVKQTPRGYQIIPNSSQPPIEVSYFDANHSKNLIITEISQLKEIRTPESNFIGLIASGESEVGVKDFEYFDEIFEHLRY